MSPVRLHSSNPNLCAELADYQTPVARLTDSMEGAGDYIKLQEDFCLIAQKGIVLYCIYQTVWRELGRLMVSEGALSTEDSIVRETCICLCYAEIM